MRREVSRSGWGEVSGKVKGIWGGGRVRGTSGGGEGPGNRKNVSQKRREGRRYSKRRGVAGGQGSVGWEEVSELGGWRGRSGV